MIKTPLTDAVSTNITATLKASPLENASAAVDGIVTESSHDLTCFVLGDGNSYCETN